MAGRQGAARHQGTGTTLTLVIHDLAQGRSAQAVAGQMAGGLRLASAAGAAGYAGVGFLHALEAELGQEMLIDCGRDAGLVLAAMRIGSRSVVFSGEPGTAGKLAQIAHRQGVRVWRRMPQPFLRLLPQEDPVRRLADRLGRSC